MTQAKGKIPREEWTEIAGRAAQGEALASIARTYGCTAPAIKYVINRLHTLDRRAAAIRSSFAEAPVSEASGAHPVAKVSKSQSIGGGGVASARLGAASALRESVYSDIAAFLVAFDAAMDNDAEEARQALVDATDRLMRAGARTRIEMERRRLPDVEPNPESTRDLTP